MFKLGEGSEVGDDDLTTDCGIEDLVTLDGTVLVPHEDVGSRFSGSGGFSVIDTRGRGRGGLHRAHGFVSSGCPVGRDVRETYDAIRASRVFDCGKGSPISEVESLGAEEEEGY